jgi:hypothetical protein
VRLTYTPNARLVKGVYSLTDLHCRGDHCSEIAARAHKYSELQCQLYDADQFLPLMLSDLVQQESREYCGPYVSKCSPNRR